MPKYTKPLPLDEYDKLSLEEKAAYITDMMDLPSVSGESPASTKPNPRDDKRKGIPTPSGKPKTP